MDTDVLTEVEDVSDQFRGTATLYKTDGEVSVDGNRGTHRSEYWVVSSVDDTIGEPAFAAMNALAGKGRTSSVNETMVFESNEGGEMVNNTEVVEVTPSDEEEAVERLAEKVRAATA